MCNFQICATPISRCCNFFFLFFLFFFFFWRARAVRERKTPGEYSWSVSPELRVDGGEGERGARRDKREGETGARTNCFETIFRGFGFCSIPGENRGPEKKKTFLFRLPVTRGIEIFPKGRKSSAGGFRQFFFKSTDTRKSDYPGAL